MQKRTLLKSVAAAALLGGAPLVSGAAAPANAVEVGLYKGADREAVLLAGAKKEGELSIYYAHPIVQVVADAFAKKYGIKIKTWRGGSEAIMQRTMAEFRAGKADVDVFLSTTADSEAAYREKMLLEVRSPVQADLIPAAVPDHHQWVAFNMDIYTAAYNTRLVKKEDLPRRYEDLLDPKWKGKLAVEANDQMWFGSLMDAMGEDKGLMLFNQIVATNGISVRKGHSLLAGMVASGEVPLALTVYSWNPAQLKRKGAPIEALFLPPLFSLASSVAVLAKAPHPHAAVLFHDFMFTEGQKILIDADYIPTSKKQKSGVDLTKVKAISPIDILRNQDKWLKLYEDTIVKRAR